MKQFFLRSIAASLLLVSAWTYGQQAQMQNLYRSISIFSGVLEDALDIKQGTGLFGISTGGIDNTYLYGQGVLLEVRTPLANRRNRASLVSLSTAMQSLQTRTNPFASAPLAVAGGVETAEMSVATTAIAQSDATNTYEDMMQQVANIDYSLLVNSAIRQASEAARSLHSVNGLSDIAYDEIRIEIDVLRNQLQTNFDQLRQLESNIGSASGATAVADSTDMQVSLQAQFDEFIQAIEPLKDEVLAMAADLQQRNAMAQLEYLSRWTADVAQFESVLYQAMCDYGSMLRDLPMEENITIQLAGLGDDKEDGRRTDKLHVFSKADLELCQSGDIDLAQLRERSASYSY